jgi:excinuclease UvrABC ATPase subunit
VRRLARTFYERPNEKLKVCLMRANTRTDWLIDLGPGAGHDGGQVIFTGIPADLVESSASLNAEHLRQYVAAD